MPVPEALIVILPVTSLYAIVTFGPWVRLAATVSSTASWKSLIVVEGCVPVWLALDKRNASVELIVAPDAMPFSFVLSAAERTPALVVVAAGMVASVPVSLLTTTVDAESVALRLVEPAPPPPASGALVHSVPFHLTTSPTAAPITLTSERALRGNVPTIVETVVVMSDVRT